MRKYDAKVGTAARVEFGVDLSEGLKAFPQTAALEPPLTTVNEALDAAFEVRRGKVKLLARVRATLRTSEYLAEQELRTFSRAVEVADGGRRGRLHGRLFPDGLVAALEPRRAQQVRVLAVLIEGVQNVAGSDVESLRTQWLPRLQQAREQLDRRVQEYTAAFAACQEAFRAELRLRLDHERIVDQLIGQVRATFPKDPARQNAVFPVASRRPVRDEDVAGDSVPASAPVPTTSPASPAAPIA